MKMRMRMNNIIRRVHFWLKEEPIDKKVCEMYSTVFLAISVLLLSALASKTMYDYIINVKMFTFGNALMLISVVWGIIGITLECIFLIAIKIYEILTERELKFPLRYKVLLSALAIPFILLAHKILIAPFIKNYEPKNSPSR
jgi:hypothetical protein